MASRFLLGFLGYYLFFCAPLIGKELPISVKAKYAILMNAKTGKVLYSKNAYDKVYPASTTKLATLLYIAHAFPHIDLNTQVTVRKEDIYKISEKVKLDNQYDVPAFWLENDGRSYGLKAGEVISLKALLYSMMLHSGNDSANVLARFFYDSIDQFMYHLNEYLREIGCKSTQFLNPHGLFHPGHFSTSYDLAKIAQQGLKYELVRTIVNSKEFACPATNKSAARVVIQSNKLLHDGSFNYPLARGMKTGYTRLAGHCFIACAENPDRQLIAVVNKLSEHNQIFRDVITMFDTAFEEKKVSRMLYNAHESEQTIPLKGSKGGLKVALKEDININYYPSEEPTVASQFIWHPLEYPIQQGQIVGEVQIKDETGKIIKSSSFVSLESKKKPFMLVILPILSSYITWVILLTLMMIFLLRRKAQVRRREI